MDSGGLRTTLTRAEFLRVAGPRAARVVAGFASGYGIDWIWARLVRGFRLERTGYPRFVLRGYRVHHNVVGYLAVALGLFALPWLMIPLGLGMIVGHRRRDRLWWFVERVG